MSLQRVSSSDKADKDAYNPLAAFRYLPVSPAVASFLRRLNVLLASYSGVDRVMMIVQVGLRLSGISKLHTDHVACSMPVPSSVQDWSSLFPTST